VLDVSGPLDDTHVVVYISKTHSEADIPQDQMHALVAWSIKLVHYCGASLHGHVTRDNYNQLQVICANPPSSKSVLSYTNTIRNPPHEICIKMKNLLSQESINLVSSKVCCSRNCVQPFPRKKILAFRQRIYQNSTFKHRTYVKTEVHRQMHRDS